MSQKKYFKILIVAPTPFFAHRGCHIRIYEIANALKERNFIIKILTYPEGENLKGLDIVRIPPILPFKKTEPGPHFLKFFLDFLMILKTFKEVCKFKPNLIHAFLLEGAFITLPIKIMKKIPVICDFQGKFACEVIQHGWKFLKLLKKIVDIFEIRLLKLMTGITTSSEIFTQYLKSKGLKNVETIWDFAPERFKTSKNKEIMKKLNLSEKDIIAVYLGILTDYQGVPAILEAAEKLKKWKFVIMGYPEDKYKERAKDLKNVIFTGKINYFEAHRYLSIGDVALAPKKSECEADGKVINYIKAGLPIIAKDTKIHREILKDAGIYYDKTEELIRILENWNKFDKGKIKKKLREREKFFEKDLLIKRLIKFYERFV